MRYEVGVNVEVVATVLLGRWIYPGERGVVVGRRGSHEASEVCTVRVRLEDGKVYTFAPGEIRELVEA